jgi:hypothetical protein
MTIGQCSRKKLFCDGLSPCGSCSGMGKEHACLRYIDSNDDRRTPCESQCLFIDVISTDEAESTSLLRGASRWAVWHCIANVSERWKRFTDLYALSILSGVPALRELRAGVLQVQFPRADNLKQKGCKLEGCIQ